MTPHDLASLLAVGSWQNLGSSLHMTSKPGDIGTCIPNGLKTQDVDDTITSLMWRTLLHDRRLALASGPVSEVVPGPKPGLPGGHRPGASWPVAEQLPSQTSLLEPSTPGHDTHACC